MKGLRLIATGGALPGRTVTNEELSRTVDTSDEWITTRTGIRTPQSRRCSAAALPRQTLHAASAPPFPRRMPPQAWPVRCRRRWHCRKTALHWT